MAKTQESDQQSRGGGSRLASKPMAVGSSGETFRHRKKSGSACRKARRTGESSSTNGGDTNCTTGASRDHNEKVSAGKIRQSCRLVGGMIGCYMFPLLSDMVLYEVTFTRCPAAGLACISQAANLQLD